MAMLLLVSFLTFALVGRMLIQYYYTGDLGVRVAKLTASPLEIAPGAMFVLSFLVSAVLIVLQHFDRLSAWQFLSPSVTAIATMLGFGGIVITVVAQFQMGRSWRIGVDPSEQTDLITTGLYTKCRNPIYSGIFLYWIGVVFNFPHPAMWVCALVCWVSIEIIVRKLEEPYLLKLHGRVFEAYFVRSHRYRLL